MIFEDEQHSYPPASWINHPDHSFAFMVQNFIDEILDQLGDARLALRLYNETVSLHADLSASHRRLRHIYAKAFIYALDAVGQLIRILRQRDQLPVTACTECELFLSQFGYLRDLRNTLQHIEDRLRGLGRAGKPIPAELLILGGFRENCYGATTAEGQYVEIEISANVLSRAYSIIGELMWCFEWVGPGNVKISRPASGA